MVTKEEIKSLKSFVFVSLIVLVKIIKPIIEMILGLIMIPFLPIQFIWWLCTKGKFFEVGIYGWLDRIINTQKD